MSLRTLPIFLTFLLMGVADAMGPLSSQVSKNPTAAMWMPFFVFIAFALCSVPAGILAARIGKKNLLLLGLGLCAVATAIPAFLNPPFALLLAAIFVLGIGTTFLQVAGNPIMRDVSPEGAYSRNLALAQGIKGAGSTLSAYLVTALTTLSFLAGLQWRAAFPFFFALMVAAFLMVLTLKVEDTRDASAQGLGESLSASLSLLGEPTFALAVLGIFLYVGAEVCMGAHLKPALQAHGYTEKQAAMLGPSLFFGALTVGRLVAGLVKVSPRTFFRLSALLGVAGLVLLATGLRALVIPGVVVAALGFANIWPMLFSITVEEKPERASELSGLMCMAISGGAVVPFAMAALGGGARAFAFVVPAACFAYLLLLSLKGGKKVEA